MTSPYQQPQQPQYPQQPQQLTPPQGYPPPQAFPEYRQPEPQQYQPYQQPAPNYGGYQQAPATPQQVYQPAPAPPPARQPAPARQPPPPRPGHPNWPPSGAPGVEEFRPPQKLVIKLFIAWIPILIPQFAVWTLLVALVPQFFGVKPPVVADFGGGVAATIASMSILYPKMKKGALSTVVRISPAGIEMTDDLGFLNRISWPDMVKVGRVTAMASQGTVKGGGGKTFTQTAIKDMGVIGWGVRRVPEKIPATMRAQLAQLPYDPASGKHYISIPLSVIEADWVNGRMAQLVQHYRPDLSWDMHAEEFGTKKV